MCGIAGYIGKERIVDEVLEKALQAMDSRGPNAHGTYKHEARDLNVYLLHKRLSIIDLDPRSNQPYHFQDWVMIFNGEIYNYLELKRELELLGHHFSTPGDTEVAIKAFAQWGNACFDKFEGMWAIAVFNKQRNELLLSRDRFGEKPLYAHKTQNGFFFASETRTLKSLAQTNFKKSLEQINRLLINGHKSLYKQPSTFYIGVDEVPIASCLSVNSTLEPKSFKYWRPQFNEESITEQEAISGIRDRLIRSTELRLRSDVPLAFCLSGGVDSSSLVSIAAKELGTKVNTFSIVDSDKRYDEEENMRATIADTGCNHHLIQLDPKENYLGKLQELVKYHDSPVATISYLVHSFLSEKIAESGFKISISGTGADEIFTGYYDHYILHFESCLNDSDYPSLVADWERYQKPFVRHPSFRSADLYVKNPNAREHIYLNNTEFATYLNNPVIEPFIETSYTKSSLLRNRMMNEMFNEVVPVILHEDDLNSMKYSIENRSPFLDRQLFDFTYSIPSKLLIKNGYAKYLLRESVKGILNDQVRLSREKKGFNASINSIVDFDNPVHVNFLMSDGPIFEIVNKRKIAELLKRKEYPNSFKKFLFNFINAKLFLEN
jgi:asparagine synthase (glutamine-hydrolysing)